MEGQCRVAEVEKGDVGMRMIVWLARDAVYVPWKDICLERWCWGSIAHYWTGRNDHISSSCNEEFCGVISLCAVAVVDP